MMVSDRSSYEVVQREPLVLFICVPFTIVTFKRRLEV